MRRLKFKKKKVCHSRKLYFRLFLTPFEISYLRTPFSVTKAGALTVFLLFLGGGGTCYRHSHEIYLGTVSRPFLGYIIYRKKSVNQRKKLDIRCLDGQRSIRFPRFSFPYA